MNKENFNKKVLKKVPFQYKEYRKGQDFKDAKFAYLKSNPDIPLKILGTDPQFKDRIVVLKDNDIITIPSQCLLLGEDRALMTFGEFDVCLN